MQVSVGAPVEYTTVGSVVSDQRVDVTSRLSGYIRAVLVQEGDRVRRGQVLVRLDPSDVEGTIRQAQTGASAAEGKAYFRWLHTGREWPDRVEVTAGLQSGERLVMVPDSALRDGDRIVGSEARAMQPKE